ncbi:MAG: hypothetical protein IKC09_02310 [Oscillospiraceae bacterium]|nr:hypothetical protein [Oscillospiraceae bacterium]
MHKSKEALIKEYEEAKAALEAGPEPGAERKKLLRTLLRNTGIVLLVLAVVLIAAGTVIWNVEALRIPVVNFFIELIEANRHLPIISIPGNDASPSENPAAPYDPATDVLEHLIPPGFSCIYNETYDNGTQSLTFLNSSTGALITYDTSVSTGSLLIDTENEDVFTTTISGREIRYVQSNIQGKQSELNVFWLSQDGKTVCSLLSTNVEPDLVWSIVTALIQDTQEAAEDPAVGTLLEGLVPRGYQCRTFKYDSDEKYTCIFGAPESKSNLLLTTIDDQMVINNDTENAHTEVFLLSDYGGLYIEKILSTGQRACTMYLHLPEKGLYYQVTGTGEAADIVWETTAALAKKLQKEESPPETTYPSKQPAPTVPPTAQEDPAVGTLLEGLVPEVFFCKKRTFYSASFYMYIYVHTDTSSRITLVVASSDGVFNVDTEGGYQETMILSGYHVLYIEEPEQSGPLSINVFLHDSDKKVMYNLHTRGLPADQVREMITVMAERIKNGYIPTGG